MPRKIRGGKKRKSVTKTTLKLASCWSRSLSAHLQKPPRLKYLCKNLVRKEAASALKESKQVCLRAHPLLLPLHHHPPPPPVQLSPDTVNAPWVLFFAHTHKKSWSLRSKSSQETLPFGVSYRPASSLPHSHHNSQLHSLYVLYEKVGKKKPKIVEVGMEAGGERTDGEQDEEYGGWAMFLSLIKAENIPSVAVYFSVAASVLLHTPLFYSAVVCNSFCDYPLLFYPLFSFSFVSEMGYVCSAWKQRYLDVAERRRNSRA